MRTITLAVIATLLTLLPSSAFSCDYPEPPSFGSALKGAKNVFIFRLDNAQYKRHELGNGAYAAWVEGTISPIQNLFGDPTRYKRIKFSTFWCGGVNLVVGHHYLIATSANGSNIELVSADGSLLDIDDFYNPAKKKANLRSPMILPVIKAIYGIAPLPANFPPRDVAARTVVPPPPPPLPQEPHV
jgi:hypothetical protein